MKRTLGMILALGLSATTLWAPPQTNPSVVVVSSPPSGGCTSNEIRMVKSSGDSYSCLGGSWTQLKVAPTELTASNFPLQGLCYTYSGGTGLWNSCGTGSGGSGTSTIGSTATTPTINCDGTSASCTTEATTILFGPGLDVNVTSVNGINSQVTVVPDYTEAQVTLTTGVTGILPVANGGTSADTAAGARSALGAAASGANSDITAITGLQGTGLAANQGGLGQTSATADSIPVGNGTAFTLRLLPDCQTGHQLLYTLSTDTFSCEVDGAVGTGTYKVVQEEGVAQGASGSGDTLNFVGPAVTASGTGTIKTITLSQSPSTVNSTSVVSIDRTLTGGVGVDIGGSDAAQDLSANRTFSTDSTEAGFVSTTAITCGAATSGKVSTQNPTLDWCDGAGTSILRHAALADTTGAALTGADASTFFQAATAVPSTKGGTGVTALPTSGKVLVSAGTSVTGSSAGTLSYNDATGGGTLTAGSFSAVGGSDGTWGSTFRDNTAVPGVPAAGYTFFYSSGGELYKRDPGDAAAKLALNNGNVTGDVTFGVTGISTIGDNKITEQLLNAANAPVTGYALTYNGSNDFLWSAAAGGISAAGPGCSSGACLTDSVVTTGSVLFNWEGSSSDANDFIINVPANPTTTIAWTVPDVTAALTFPGGTDTVVARATTDTLTNKTLDGGDAGAGTTRPAGSDILKMRTHNTDCTTLADGKQGEECIDEDDGKIWACIPTAGDCDTGAEWLRVDSGGAGSPGGSDTQLQFNNASAFGGMAGFTYVSPTLTVADAKLLDMSGINNSSTSEGLKLPQASDVSTGTAAGQIGWDSDGKALYVGDGLAVPVLIGGDRSDYIEEVNECNGDDVPAQFIWSTGAGGPPTIRATDDTNDPGQCACNTAASAAGFCTLPIIAYNAGNNIFTGSQRVNPAKLRRFAVKMAPFTSNTNQNILVGGIHMSGATDLNTKIDGMYFWCGPTADVDNNGTVEAIDVDGDTSTNGAASCATDADDCKWWAVADRAVTVATGTNWIMGIGAPSGRTATATTQTCVSTTWHKFEITYDGTNARWYLDNTIVQTVATANIPSASLGMWGVVQRNTDTSAATNAIGYLYYRGTR